MLIDKINGCTFAINELSVLRTAAIGLGAYEASVNKMTVIESMVTEYVSTVEEMNRHEFCKLNLSDEDIGKMREAITTCVAEVNAMTLNKNDVTALISVFETQKKMLTVFWQSKAKEYVEPLRSYLSIINTFVPNKQEVSDLIRVLGTGATAVPNAAVVRTLVANAKKANGIASNFQMSEGVRAFLKKAKDGRATYVDITDDVAKWIKEHNLGSKVKVSF